MNTRVYLLVLSIALIVESSPLPCSCKSGLNSPLESTACSCSKQVVIPAQFTAVKPPPCDCQSISQPKPQPMPQNCIPQQPSPQPCIPLPMPPPPQMPPQTVRPCVPQPCIKPQPCIPAGSTSGQQPCAPTPVKSNSIDCVPVPSIQYTLPSSNNISKKDKFEKKEKSQLEDFFDETKDIFCNKGGAFGGKTTVCMKWPSWMADIISKFKCKIDCWSKSHDSSEPLIL